MFTTACNINIHMKRESPDFLRQSPDFFPCHYLVALKLCCIYFVARAWQLCILRVVKSRCKKVNPVHFKTCSYMLKRRKEIHL